MSRYRKSTPVPLIAAGVLLAGFVALVVWAKQGGKEQAPLPAPTPTARGPEPAPAPPPVEAPPAEEPPAAKPVVRLTPAEAKAWLKNATVTWRAFTLDLCQRQKWPDDRAVAFLEKVTWNDRDLEKQYAHGIASFRAMLGLEGDDPVALAEALAAQGDLRAWFAESWPKLEVDWKPEEKVTVLEDRWKPNRIRWGFPLDTPVDLLEAFQQVSLQAMQVWQGLAGAYVGGLDIDETEKAARWRTATGEGLPAQEAKMRAALRVLVDKPKASYKEAVEAFFKLVAGKNQEELQKEMLDKLPAAFEAAQKAE